MDVKLRPWPEFGRRTPTVMACVNGRAPAVGPSCRPRGGDAVAAALEAAIAERGLKLRFKVVYCLSACTRGPNVMIDLCRSRFLEVQPEDVPELLDIVERHLAER